MSTHEQFIERETASLARKAGFDWKVTSFYNPEGNVCYCSSACNFNGEIGEYHDLSRPTQSVLQRWLREVKKYYISVYPRTEYEKGTVYGFSIYKEDYDYYVCHLYTGEPVKTYEEALEIGLVKCLTFILKSNE